MFLRGADHVHVGGPEFLGDAAVAVLCDTRSRGDLARRYRNEAQWLGGMLELY